ncbi:encapsulin, partial [Candidatus Sumerlaeota bacterium]|nr:encapsulin [Candidatus Sumerlaeota bacterium]
VRVPFSLNLDEMDAVSRGLQTPELEGLEIAAQKAAHFEEKAVYYGFAKGGVEGIIPSSPHASISMEKDPGSYLALVENGVMTLKKAGIDGPYLLILGTTPFQVLRQGNEKGYPLKNRIQDLLGGGISWSPALKGGILLSSRGGDFVLTVGQDFSIGYSSHDAQNINLFITESFTFQVLEPRAAMELKWGK